MKSQLSVGPSFVTTRQATSLLLMTLCSSVVACAGEEPLISSQSLAATSSYVPWETRKAEKQAELDAYLADNANEFWWFRYTPVGSIGIPTALLTEWPVLFPDIYGGPLDYMAPQGFGPDPWNPANPLPFGLGRTFMQPGVEIATVTCAGCHVGRVIGPDGNVIHLVGAPNTQFNQLRTAVEDTVNDPRWELYYGNVNPVTNRFRDVVRAKRHLIDITLGAWTFNPERVDNPPYLHNREKPGYLDAIGVAVHAMTVPDIYDPAKADWVREAVLPPWPAQIDIMSVWRQRVRPLAQWDGSIASDLYRNLAAEVGVISDPTKTDFQNAVLTTDFTADLPPPVYPFPVDDARAARGKQLFEQHCASCHYDGNTRIFPPEQTRTDPNRSLTITVEGRKRVIAALRKACTDPARCNLTDEEIVRDVSVPGRLGYLAPPLDGIWARAPYLHNGSVPTLEHLLVPSSRPTYFARGNVKYDPTFVGFAWDQAAAAEPNTYQFDTTEAGGSNAGHDSLGFLGRDWSKYPADRRDLIEYMKTL